MVALRAVHIHVRTSSSIIAQHLLHTQARSRVDPSIASISLHRVQLVRLSTATTDDRIYYRAFCCDCPREYPSRCALRPRKSGQALPSREETDLRILWMVATGEGGAGGGVFDLCRALIWRSLLRGPCR